MQGRTARLALVGGFAAVLAAACGSDVDGLPTDWRFENRTNGPLTIVWERESGEAVALTTVGPGEKATVSVNQYGNPQSVCQDGEMAAVDLAGVELDRWSTTCEIVTIPVPLPS